MRIENRRCCRSIAFYQPDFSDEMFRFGQLSLLLAGLGLSYYTAWVILLPFVDPEFRPLVARLVHNLFKTHFHACPPPKKRHLHVKRFRQWPTLHLIPGSSLLLHLVLLFLLVWVSPSSPSFSAGRPILSGNHMM